MRAVLSLVLIAGCASGTVAGADGAGGDDAGGDPDAAATSDGPGPAPDAGVDASACANTPCDLYSQCGCTAAAPVCDLDPANLATGATACRIDQFGGGEATLCTRSTTCAASSASSVSGS